MVSGLKCNMVKLKVMFMDLETILTKWQIWEVVFWQTTRVKEVCKTKWAITKQLSEISLLKAFITLKLPLEEL